MKLFSRFNNAITTKNSHIKSLRIACICLTAVCGMVSYGWYSSPKSMTIHIPPDLRAGSTRPWYDIPEGNIYAFTYYIFQQLNAWSNNGENDYLAQIQRLKPYLTPHCQTYLEEDYKLRKSRNELEDRTRSISEIPGRGFDHSRVKKLSNDSWEVLLDVSVNEYYNNELVKKVLTRFDINTVSYDVNQELNPWGMALNCYMSKPKRIELKDKENDAI